MALEILMILEKGIWFGFAALGFAILFNVPQRTLLIIWSIGALGRHLETRIHAAQYWYRHRELCRSSISGYFKCLCGT